MSSTTYTSCLQHSHLYLLVFLLLLYHVLNLHCNFHSHTFCSQGCRIWSCTVRLSKHPSFPLAILCHNPRRLPCRHCHPLRLSPLSPPTSPPANAKSTYPATFSFCSIKKNIYISLTCPQTHGPKPPLPEKAQPIPACGRLNPPVRYRFQAKNKPESLCIHDFLWDAGCYKVALTLCHLIVCRSASYGFCLLSLQAGQ